MATQVKIDFSPEQILKLKGLEKNGPAQRFFVGEFRDKMDPYVPFDHGVLKNTAIENQDSMVIRLQNLLRSLLEGKQNECNRKCESIYPGLSRFIYF